MTCLRLHATEDSEHVMKKSKRGETIFLHDGEGVMVQLEETSEDVSFLFVASACGSKKGWVKRQNVMFAPKRRGTARTAARTAARTVASTAASTAASMI